MNPGDTIAAVATGAGPSPRAVIRLSGPATAGVLARVLRRPPANSGGHRSVLRLDHSDEALDFPCLVVRFCAPRSYTGQDAAEIQLAGNPALTERVLSLVLSAEDGVRHAEPGEFTARAYLAGKLSLDQAEGVNAIISARGSGQLAAAQRLLRGEVGVACRALADELTACMALVEAGIDFSDQEDVVAITPHDLRARVMALISGIDALAGPEAPFELAAPHPVVVLAGPTNAGKSTLFNALLGRRRAVTSDQRGTTRDALREPLELDDAAPHTQDDRPRTVTLVDLAGLDAALAERTAGDRASQAAARRLIAEADVVVLCRPVDAPPFDEREIPLQGQILLRVGTKADRPPDPRDAGSPDALSVCALDGRNLGPLRRAIADAAFGAPARGRVDRDAWVLPRHRRSLRAARQSLLEIAPASGGVDPRPELAAASLRAALDEIGSIVGAVTPDDVIGRIFASFCIGK